MGTDAAFEIGTWNIEWLGSSGNGPTDDALQMQNAVRVITESSVDLWSLQELSSAQVFSDLMAALGPEYDGRVTTVQSNLLIAFVYRIDTIRLRRVQNILTSFSSAFAGRPPLKVEVDVTLPDTTFIVSAISVHMKATSDVSSYQRRVEASERLKTHIDFTLPGEAVIVAGDFNDELTRSITSVFTSPYQNFVDDDRYEFLTAEMEAAQIPSFCGNSSSCSSTSTIDHIMVTSELSVGASIQTDRLAAALSEINRYVFTTSDHLPVFARILPGAATGVGVETPLETPSLELYPNPARGLITVQAPGPGTVRIVDVLGRTMNSRIYDGNPVSIDTKHLAPGLYGLEWSSRAGKRLHATFLSR